MKLLVIGMLIAIVLSLGSALYFLATEERGSRKMLNALKIRVGLSIALIVLLVVAYRFGWLNS